MFETVMNIMILALAIEAVILVLMFTGWLGTLAQKNMKEAEAAEAQRIAWNAQTALTARVQTNLQEAKEAMDAGMKEVVTAAMMNERFPSPRISH